MTGLEHYQENKETFEHWINENARLQLSSDIIQPLVADFMKEFPTTNLSGCQDCIIDMLQWYKIQIGKPKTDKKK